MFNYDTDGDNFDNMSDMGLNRNRKSIKSKAQFSMHKDFQENSSMHGRNHRGRSNSVE